MKGHHSLNILYCVNCNKNAITSETFPHYCGSCLSYLKKHGEFPARNRTVEQSDLSLEEKEIEQDGLVPST